MKIFKSGIQANTGRVYNLKSWAIFRSIPTSWRTKLSFFSLFSFFFIKLWTAYFLCTIGSFVISRENSWTRLKTEIRNMDFSLSQRKKNLTSHLKKGKIIQIEREKKKWIWVERQRKMVSGRRHTKSIRLVMKVLKIWFKVSFVHWNYTRYIPYLKFVS